MTSASPWSVKGIDPKARELAKDLARRSGMTLGEWLNQVIIDGEAEAPPVEGGYRGVPARDYTSPGEPFRKTAVRSPDLGGIRQIVDQLAVRIEAAEQRSTLAISGVDQSVMGVLSRLEAVERDQSAVASRFGAAFDEIGGTQDRFAGDMRRLSDTVTARDADARDAIAGVRADLRQIAERVGSASTSEADPASGVMDAVVSRIAGRLDEAEQRTADAVKRLEASFAELDARLRTSEATSSAVAEGVERRFEGLTAELTARVEASRADLTDRLRQLASGRMEKVEAGIEALQTQVEARERRSAQALDRMGREVMRIASSLSDRVARAEITSAEAVDRVSGDVSRLSGALDQKFSQQEAVQAEALERLGGEISRIAEKLTERISHTERRSAQSVDDMGQQLGRLSERLSQRLDQSHSQLSERLRQSEARTSRFIEEAQSTIGARLGEAQRRGEDRAMTDAGSSPVDTDEAIFGFDAPRAEGEEALRQPLGEGSEHHAGHAFTAGSTDENDPFAGADPLELDPFVDDAFAGPHHAHDGATALKASAPTIVDLSDDGETLAEYEPATPIAASDTEGGFHAAHTAPRELATDTGIVDIDRAFGHRPSPSASDDFLLPFDDEHALDVEPDGGLAAHGPASAKNTLSDEDGFDAGGRSGGAEQTPLTTREILQRARAAARDASERPEIRLRRGGPGSKASVEAPPLETKNAKGFSFPFRKKKKKDGVTVRTALLASGTAAALAVTGAGALLLVNSEISAPSDRQSDHFGVAPTAALNLPGDGAVGAQAPMHLAAPPVDHPAAPDASGPAGGAPGKVQAAVALAPAPAAMAAAPSVQAVATSALSAAEPVSDDAAKSLYSAAVRRISGDDFGGVDGLRKSANLGYAPAQFYLAKLYETGGAGLTKDMVAARRWTERAANAGDPAAMHNLGLYFYEGDGGPQDAAQAANWFRRAALLGIRDSQFNLALLYSKGYGVPQNLTEAYTWYLVAAISGDDGAKNAARAIRPQLSSDAQSAAERAAAAFKAQTQAASRATVASNTP